MPVHRRICSSRPSRALFTQSGSAMSARTSVMPSASWRSRIPSASSGVRIRCTVNTGVWSTAFLIACAAYTPNMCGE